MKELKFDQEDKKLMQEMAREYKKSTGWYLFRDTRKKKGGQVDRNIKNCNNAWHVAD